MTGCTLCGLDLPADPVTDDDVSGQFCCRGCLAVSRSLDAAPEHVDDPEAAVETGDVEDAEGEVAYLSVDGMHCGTCELFLEDAAVDHQGVSAASASYATDAMKVVYDPDTLSASDLPDLVSRAGYEASRRSDSGSEAPDSPTARFLVGGGFFGMMAMLWYVLFVYPQHFGLDPVVEFGTFGRLYLLGQIWLFSSVVLFYTGFPLLRGAYVSLRAGQPNMDLLVSLAAVSAYAYSTAVTLLGGIDVYFDVTIAIVLVVTAGNYYEERVKRSAVSRLAELTAETVSEARLRGGDTVPVEEVQPGAELLVNPGERVPLDGVILEGVAAVDEALVTGESLPVTRRPGEAVPGGAVVTDQPLVVEVSGDATSTLDRIVGLLWDVQSTRSGAQRLADKLATVFVPVVTTLAVLAAGGVLATGGSPTGALLVGLTVLIVSCPCALGLATPLAVAVGVGRAATERVVVASETLFETLPETDVVVLDKTGTLTTGRMSVVDSDFEGAALERAAALERYSNHPVADAVVAFAGDASRTDGGRGVGDPKGPPVDAVSIEPKGVVGRVGGEQTVVGHPDLLTDEGLTIPQRYREAAADAMESGQVPVAVGWNGRCRGLLTVSDEPRNDWEDVVSTLAGDGREIVVLTGDESAAADRFEASPEVDEVFAGVPPDGKVATVERLRNRGTVVMVGDGANDAPALAAADVGVALAHDGTLAADAADAVVMDGRLGAVPTLFRIAARTRGRIRQNLGWAFGYNAVAIPLAASGALNPLFAALAMAASSTLVVLNSSRHLVSSE